MPSLTIDVTAPQAQRVMAAFTTYLRPVDGNGDPRPAVASDVKAYIKSEIKRIVLNMEKQAAEQAVTVPDFD